MKSIDSSRPISLGSGVDDEGGGVKPFHHCRVAEDTGSNTVGAIRLPIVQRCCVGADHIKACAAANMEEAGVFPSADQRVQHTVDPAEKGLSPSNRQLNSELSVENMGNVLLGGAVILVQVAQIEVVAVAEIATVSVTSIDKNIFLDVGGEPHRHGVIVAPGLRVGDWNVSELGIKAVERTLRVVINARRLRERLVNIAG